MNLKFDNLSAFFSAVYKMQCQWNDVTNTNMGRQCVLKHIKIKMYSLLILTDFDLLKYLQFDTIYAALKLGHNLWHTLYERNGSRAKSCRNGRQVNLHRTHCVQISMSNRKMKFISYVYTLF